LYLSDLNGLCAKWVSLSSQLNERTSSFFTGLRGGLPVEAGKQNAENNTLNMISLVPLFVITTVRAGFSSIRFSHWT